MELISVSCPIKLVTDFKQSVINFKSITNVNFYQIGHRFGQERGRFVCLHVGNYSIIYIEIKRNKYISVNIPHRSPIIMQPSPYILNF